MKKLLKQIISLLSKSRIVYLFGRKVVDYHDNLNNCELETNGELSFIKRNLQAMKTVFDVGANVGEWSLLLNRLKPEVAIYSFEPVKETFKTLISNNFNENVKPQNCGLGSEVGTTDFFVYGQDSTLNSAHDRGVAELNKPEVETVTIETVDHFCASNGIAVIDFLKIDTEGHEFAVLKGAAEFLKNHQIKMIQFEYGGTYIDSRVILKDVYGYLKQFGYEIYKIFPNHLELIPEYSQALENFQYSNFIAAAPDIEVK